MRVTVLLITALTAQHETVLLVQTKSIILMIMMMYSNQMIPLFSNGKGDGASVGFVGDSVGTSVGASNSAGDNVGTRVGDANNIIAFIISIDV